MGLYEVKSFNTAKEVISGVNDRRTNHISHRELTSRVYKNLQTLTTKPLNCWLRNGLPNNVPPRRNKLLTRISNCVPHPPSSGKWRLYILWDGLHPSGRPSDSKRLSHSKCWQKDVKERDPHSRLVGVETKIAILYAVVEPELPWEPTIALQGVSPRTLYSTIDSRASQFITALSPQQQGSENSLHVRG